MQDTGVRQWKDVLGRGGAIQDTAANQPTLVANRLNGKPGIVFDGSNDYVELYSTSLLKSSPFTVSFWIYVETFGSVYGSCALSQYYTVCGPVASYLGYSNTFMASIQTAAGGNAEGVVKESNFAKNRWYYYCSVYDGSAIGNTDRLKIFIDGVQKSLIYDATVPSSPYTVSSTLALGYPPPAYPYFNGRISNLQIYNKALTQQEISQNYNATKGRFVNSLPPVRDGLVLELDAGQRASYSGTGNTWYDLSGNSLNGTLFNAPAFSGIGASSSILFNASNQVATLGLNSKLDISESITIAAFIYPTAYNTTGDYGSFIICKAASYYLELGGNGKVRVYFYSLSSEGYHEGVGTVPLNTWSYICVVRNKATSTISMYINGILDRTLNSITGDIRVQQSYAVNLASFQGSGYTFTGRIAVGTIYNRALSAYEIKQNFDYYRTRYNI